MGQLKLLFIAAQIAQLQKRTPLQAALAFREGWRKRSPRVREDVLRTLERLSTLN